ncbi:MAG: hypothetical protein J6V63_01435, partial [Spirochaetaceae bacterium]|nr:hypothetical protein [Spirochaetaceae bacterium]
EAQEEAAKEVEKLKEEQQELRDAQKEATEAKQEAQKAQAEAQKNPKDEEAQQKAEDAQKKADEAQQAVEEQKQAVEEQKQVVEEKQKEAEEQQEIADQKREEARHDRAEIAKDQQQLIEQRSQPASDGVFGLKYLDDEYSVLTKLDKNTGKLLKESPVTVIRGRTVLPADENFIAIAGSNSGNGAVKLVLLDTVNMEIVGQSNEVASEKSVLVKDGYSYYAVIKDGGNWLVGKYDSKLTLQLKSKIAVHEATPITLTESGLVVTDAQGVVRLLSYSDLSMVKE